MQISVTGGRTLTATLFRHEDKDGTIEVLQESAGVRTLRFGTASKQSSVDPDEPHRLILPYTRILTAGLLFRADPRRVLLLGLGGGALAHFFLHHFPDCTVTAVESWPRVVAVARDYFDLPVDDPRLKVRLADARSFLTDPAEVPDGGWDLVIVDTYAPEGPAPGTTDRSFYTLCRAGMAPGGVLAAHLWSSHRRILRHALAALRTEMEPPAYSLQARGRANVAALAGPGGLPEPSDPGLARRAAALEAATDLAYRQYLADLQPVRRGWL
mgnify:CR=1 FL=1